MQSKTDSFIEAWSGTFIGFFLSILVQQFIVNPLYDLQQTFAQNLGIVTIFTIVSALRSYFIRRFFNQKHKVSKP